MTEAVFLGTVGLQPAFLQQKVLQTVRANPLFRSRSGLKREIEVLPPVQFKQLVDILTKAAAKEKNAFSIISRMSGILSLEKMQAAIRLQYPQHVNAIRTAKDLYKQAKHFLEMTEDKLPLNIKTKLGRILDSLIQILESLLNGFGIAEFFKPAENDVHSDMKGQKIMLILSLFSIISAVLIPLLGPSLTSKIVGGTILSIAVFSLIYPVLRPAPSKLPKGENWTQLYRNGDLRVMEGRKEILDEIAQSLSVDRKGKKHVMLLGKTGVGKTETMKAFVKAVERGDYPELKGKQVVYFNTADLVNNAEMFTNGNRTLSRISEKMGSHRQKYILIFDEIHMACQKREESLIADQLKTLLDDSKENFPYVVGITTESDYFRDIFRDHAPFARRFKNIVITNTDDSETLNLLSNAYLKMAPKILLDQGIMQVLLQKTKEAFGNEAPQPGMAMRILSRCIQRTAESQKTALETRIDGVRERIQSIYAQGAIEQGNRLLPYGRENLALQLEMELQNLEKDLKTEREEIGRLFQARDILAASKRKMFQMAVKISEGFNPSSKHKTEFLLLSHFFNPFLEAKVRAEAERLNIKTVINAVLIEQVIAEEKQNQERANQIIQALG